MLGIKLIAVSLALSAGKTLFYLSDTWGCGGFFNPPAY